MRFIHRASEIFNQNLQKTEGPHFDLFSNEVHRNPYPYYRELRKHFPVHYFKKHHVWAVSRYENIVGILKRPDLFSAHQKGAVLRSMNNTDGPEHTRIRKMGSVLSSDRYVSGLEERIQFYTDQSIQKILGAGRNFDLMDDFAFNVPLFTVAGLLDIELERERDLKRWILSWIIRTPCEQKEKEDVLRNMAEFNLFLQQHIQDCHNHKGFVAKLLKSTGGSEKITSEEAVELAKLLLLAGTLTTSNLVGNAILALVNHPMEMTSVINSPHLIPELIEETLRYDTPAPFIPRTVMNDVEVGGTALRTGDSLGLLIGSANRDERQFSNPDQFFIKRNPQKHIAFGEGSHYCLGARLARLQARIMLEALLLKLPRLQPVEPLDSIEYVDSVIVRGPRRLELSFLH